MSHCTLPHLLVRRLPVSRPAASAVELVTNDRLTIVRRGYPDGAPQWLSTTDHPVTALDTDGDTVFAALTSGEVVALDAAGGTLRWRTRLTVDGIPTVALSLTVAESGHLLLGTVDGRILVADRQL